MIVVVVWTKEGANIFIISIILMYKWFQQQQQQQCSSSTFSYQLINLHQCRKKVEVKILISILDSRFSILDFQFSDSSRFASSSFSSRFDQSDLMTRNESARWCISELSGSSSLVRFICIICFQGQRAERRKENKIHLIEIWAGEKTGRERA